MKPKEMLKEWVIAYAKAEVSLRGGDIQIIQGQEGCDLITKNPEKQECYVIFPSLKDCVPILNQIGEKDFFIITFNTKENFSTILELWANLVKFPRLCVMFVNPKAFGDKKWAVFPHTHHRITEKSALKKGLLSLAQQVTEWKE